MSLHIWLTRGLAFSVKALTHLFFRVEVSWVSPPAEDAWQNIRVFAFLNHTSLLEPLFLAAMPASFLWDAASRTLIPGADITMKRPIVGRFFKYFSPKTVAITRKRDESWDHFLAQIQPDSLVALAAEGRMMRANGLDKDGQPMSVRGGIADILRIVGQGKLLVGYSGGLHHINIPGQRAFRLFKTIRIRYELIDIADYLASFQTDSRLELRSLIAHDLEARLLHYQPEAATPDSD